MVARDDVAFLIRARFFLPAVAASLAHAVAHVRPAVASGKQKIVSPTR